MGISKKLHYKSLLFMPVFLLILVLSACGSGDDKGTEKSAEESADASTEASSESSGDKLIIGFSQVGAESEFRTANTNSIKEAIKNAGHELQFSDAQQKQENQIKAIRSFIAQDVDAIILAPVVETGFETVLQEVKDADIPLFLVDRAVDVEDESMWVTFLGSDFVEEGKKAGYWTIDEFADHEGELNIVELQGTVGSAPAIDRKEGFEEILADHPEFKITQSQSGDFTRAKGKEVMEAFLKKDGDNIDLLFAHNDDMAIGAIQAIEEYGLNPGEDIKVIGMDAVKGAFEAMADGKMNVTIECNPLFGPQLVELIDDYFAGEELDKRVVVEEGMFTMDQAEALLPTREY